MVNRALFFNFELDDPMQWEFANCSGKPPRYPTYPSYPQIRSILPKYIRSADGYRPWTPSGETLVARNQVFFEGPRRRLSVYTNVPHIMENHIGHTHVGRYACRRNGIRMRPSRNNRRRRFNIIQQSYTPYIERRLASLEPLPSRPRNFHFNPIKGNKEMREKRK